MPTATMCVAAWPAHAAATVFGDDARAGRPGAVREIRRPWQNHTRIAASLSLDISRPKAGR
jgi:hypothetical protein